jgi:hypothetical protein
MINVFRGEGFNSLKDVFKPADFLIERIILFHNIAEKYDYGQLGYHWLRECHGS